jgi:hypothetical protein
MDFRDYPGNQSHFIEDGIRAGHLMRAGYHHVNAYFPWVNFDPTWWPGVSGPDATFEAVATAVRPALEKVQVLPRRVPVGCGLVDAPASSWDSRTQDLIQRLTAQLRKPGASI